AGWAALAPRVWQASVMRVAVEDPADESGLCNLLRVVAGNAYKADTKSYRRVPVLINNAVEGRIRQRSHKTSCHFVHSAEVAEQQFGITSYGCHLFGGMSVACVRGGERQAPPSCPTG